MARFLGFEGFNVAEASNGVEALAYLRAGSGAAAILLDLRMPLMDGWAFAACNAPTLRLPTFRIVISGADTHRFGELHAVATLEKPVEMSSVVSLLRELLPNS
jgi:CheY-like chemotaxis protein